ncbi:hypothetical protein BDV25DRAFT_136269 [Aspergillus avenaceus]|uniref:Uncharacterized protein n=1 Tax=Aspergillus avenaceus TaxID=36643 RepID=A0A5N6U646_ASPAV|nr:hypothetical protein BDV25DRAFT_136269 [Aspergillus avenaceus]
MSNRLAWRVLVANRGEIAVRILQAARELSPSIETFALYTEDDRSHCDFGRPHHSLQLPSAAAYLDIVFLVDLAREHKINIVHPGYGFLSESAEFARNMHNAGVSVVGPGPEILLHTADKLAAKRLAMQCNVPVLPTITHPTADVSVIQRFAHQVSYPIMIKAVDGGGGRGIRLVRREDELESAVRGATNESPSQTVFAEKAAVEGFHHLEVQVIGDGIEVCHLWERDCSLQRRFQKIVEFAPSLIRDKGLVQQVVDAALRMAKTIRYRSLGTVEFLVNEQQGEFYFLEINPRVQVEHTVTEAITGVDLVQTQLQMSMGLSLAQVGLMKENPVQARGHSIQLRLCAESPRKGFSLSMGKITQFNVPSGHGARVDTHVDMTRLSSVSIGANFDNLLAKIIVSASTWEAAVAKARRVLEDTSIYGVQTNLDLLRGIISHDDILTGHVDTHWLEAHLKSVIDLGDNISQSVHRQELSPSSHHLSLPNLPASNLLFRPGDAWSMSLESLTGSQKQQQHLQLTRVLQNDFPSSLTAEVKHTLPGASTAYRMHLASTSTSATALLSSSHRRGDPHNPHHIILPLSGQLIEILVAPGQEIAKEQVVAFVKQMKMELEIRSPRDGRARWVYEMGAEEDVAEGMLLIELEDHTQAKL